MKPPRPRSRSAALALTLLLSAPDTGVRTFDWGGADGANAIIPLRGGGAMVVGYASKRGAGGVDGLAIRLNAAGDTLWTRTYGGGKDDHLWSVAERRDGGFVAVGFTESFGGGDSDIWLVGIDSAGNEQWRRTIGDAGEQLAWDVKATSTGDFVVAAQTASSNGNVDGLVVRVDATGNVRWQTTIGGSGIERIFSVALTSGDTLVVAGTTTTAPARDVDMLVAKLAPDGALHWRKMFGGAGNDIGHSIVADARGMITVAGYAPRAIGEPNDITLTRLDRNGNVVWNRRIGGPQDDRLIMIASLPDGGFALAANTQSYGAGEWDGLLVRVDSSGKQIWQQTIGGSGIESLNAVAPDGNRLLVAGYTESVTADRDVFVANVALDSAPRQHLPMPTTDRRRP